MEPCREGNFRLVMAASSRARLIALPSRPSWEFDAFVETLKRGESVSGLELFCSRATTPEFQSLYRGSHHHRSAGIFRIGLGNRRHRSPQRTGEQSRGHPSAGLREVSKSSSRFSISAIARSVFSQILRGSRIPGNLSFIPFVFHYVLRSCAA